MKTLYSLVLILMSVPCHAQAIYTYTGQNFTNATGVVTTSDYVSVSLTFSLALPPNDSVTIFTPSAWTVSDGVSTLSSSDGSSTIIAQMTTDATGKIASWDISGFGTGVLIGTCVVSYQCNNDTTMHTDVNANITGTGSILSNPGAWTLTQSAPVCNFSLSQGMQTFPSSGGNANISVTAPQGCSWSITGAPSWVIFSGALSGSGNGIVNYQVVPNPGAARTATITVAGLPFTVEQAAANISVLTAIGSLAQVASGGGWQTTLSLVNMGVSATEVRVDFFDNNGIALSLPLTFVQSGALTTASTLSQTIDPGATLVVLTGSNVGPPLVGSAQLTITGTVSGFAIFRYIPTGQEAVVPLETRNASAYVLVFDNTNGIATGVALANISNQAANVPVVLRDDTGASLGTATINLAARGHTSFMLTSNYASVAGKRGTVEFDAPAGTQISVLGLRATPTGATTTIPMLTE